MFVLVASTHTKVISSVRYWLQLHSLKNSKLLFGLVESYAVDGPVDISNARPSVATILGGRVELAVIQELVV